MKSTRKWIAAIMAVLMLVLMAACGNGGNAANENKAGYRTLEEIKAAGTINIGVFSDKNPFGYVDENGEYQGYDVYFARRLAEDLGVKVNFISTEAANRIEYLKTGKVDVILANFTVTPARAEEVDFALDMKDLRIDTFRSSGAGGQHINKTSSAIRITHIPTGTVVECQNERSQFQNKDKALEILRSRLLAQKQKEQQDAINAQRQGQVGTGDRSEKIRTYNFPQDRCTDHRIGLTVHNLEKIMDGNLDEVIDALATREQTEKLQRLGG